MSKQVKESQTEKKVMASEQIMSEVITGAVAEATRIAIQCIEKAWVERTPGASGPKIGSPAMKQPTFDWSTLD